MTKKARQFFEGTKIGATPSVAAPGNTNPSDATGGKTNNAWCITCILHTAQRFLIKPSQPLVISRMTIKARPSNISVTHTCGTYLCFVVLSWQWAYTQCYRCMVGHTSCTNVVISGLNRYQVIILLYDWGTRVWTTCPSCCVAVPHQRAIRSLCEAAVSLKAAKKIRGVSVTPCSRRRFSGISISQKCLHAIRTNMNCCTSWILYDCDDIA